MPGKTFPKKKTLEEDEAAACSDGDDAAEVDSSNPRRKRATPWLLTICLTTPQRKTSRIIFPSVE